VSDIQIARASIYPLKGYFCVSRWSSVHMFNTGLSGNTIHPFLLITMYETASRVWITQNYFLDSIIFSLFLPLKMISSLYCTVSTVMFLNIINLIWWYVNQCCSFQTICPIFDFEALHILFQQLYWFVQLQSYFINW